MSDLFEFISFWGGFVFGMCWIVALCTIVIIIVKHAGEERMNKKENDEVTARYNRRNP